MAMFNSSFPVTTNSSQELVDITSRLRHQVGKSGIENGVCHIYAMGATAAVMIQENADPNIALDVLDCLSGLVPGGRWRHDRIDDNGAAHIKAGLVGPSETIPVREGKLLLSTWQNVFLCDFDGPRKVRQVVVTIMGE